MIYIIHIYELLTSRAPPTAAAAVNNKKEKTY